MPKIFKFSPMWWNFDKFGHTNRYHYQIVSFFYFLFIIKLTYFIDCYSITISTLKSLRQSCVNRYSFVQYDTYFTNYNDHVETAFLFILPTNIPNHLLTYLPNHLPTYLPVPLYFSVNCFAAVNVKMLF